MNPLVMVLLLFAPVIANFWIFVAYYGLGKRYDKFIKGTSTKALEFCILFWSFMILGLIAQLFPNTIFAVIVFVVMLLAFVVFISMMYRFTRCIDKMPRI